MLLEATALASIIKAIGWALVHFLWQGALVGLLFAAGRAIFREAHPSIRYRLGLVCLLLLALAPLVTAWSVYYSPTAAASSAPRSAAIIDSGVPLLSSAAQETALSWSDWFERALPYIVATWAIGVLLMSTRVMLKLRRMRRLMRVGVRDLPAEWNGRITRLKSVFGIRQAVQVWESTLIEVPMIMGWIKPVILLPTSSLVGLTPHQLELVIAHELGHIRRLDYLVNLLQVAMETVLYYHPVVGWISRVVREEREKCCDDLVISQCGQPIEYAKALANLESIRAGDFLPAVGATDGQLVQRIERIVHNHRAEPREAVAGNTTVLLLIALAVLAAGRASDPLRALEERRSQLADELVAELMMSALPAQEKAFLAPLANARVAVARALQSTPPSAAVSGASQAPKSANATAEPRMEVVSTLSSIGPPSRPDISLPTLDQQPIELPGEAPAFQIARAALPDLNTPGLDAVSVEDGGANSASGQIALRRVAPEYPVRARIAGQTGFVELSFEIDAIGRPTAISVEEAQPRRIFDRAAVTAMKQWRFDVTRVDAGDRLHQRIDFSIEGSGPMVRPDGECDPVTGTRICRRDSPSDLAVRQADRG